MYQEQGFKEVWLNERKEYKEIIVDGEEIVVSEFDEKIDSMPEERRLLIVEDNWDSDLKIMEFNLGNILKMDRIKYDRCASYQEFSRLEDKKIDVAIVDLKLSDRGDDYEGLKVVNELNRVCPYCQVIIFSNHLESKIELERACGLNIKCHKILAKGIDWQKLPKAVFNALDLSLQEKFRLEKEKILEEKRNIEIERDFLAEEINQNFLTRAIAAELIHDLKNPLTGIMGYADLFKDELETEFNKRIDNVQLLIQKKMSPDEYKKQETDWKDVIDDLLKNFKKNLEELKRRFDIGMDYHRPKNESVVLVGETIKKMLEFLCKNKKIGYEFKMNEDCFLVVNGEDLRMIMENVICNAIQSMQARRGCSLSNLIKVKVINGEKDVLVEVEDNGLGLPSYDVKTLCTGGITTKENGSGLGLRTINRILKSYNANMNLEDVVGGGARMTLWFPKKISTKNG